MKNEWKKKALAVCVLALVVSPLVAAYFMGQVDAEDPLLAQLHYRRFLYGGN